MFGLKSSPSHSDPWPLKFRHYDFGVRCYNTLRCNVVYNNYCFTRLYVDTPSGAPSHEDWRDSWSAGHDGGLEFGPPVAAEWVSLDGVDHHALIDIGELFEDRLVRHCVSKEDIPEGWLAAWGVDPLSVDIVMEVNDRTISVYMRAHVTTKLPQIPDNPRSCARRDLVPVWAYTY